MAKKVKEFKRCPRCDTKTLIFQDKCPACGLIYSRLSNASNKEAKKALKKGEKHKVICDKTLPKDVGKWKLFFLALFFGMFGGHHYYIGKYKTAIAYTVSTVLLVVGAIIAQNDSSVWAKYYFWMWFFILPASGCLIMLAVDLVRILANSFKVPIAIREDIVVNKEKLEGSDAKEVLKIVEEVTDKVNKQVKEANKEEQTTDTQESKNNTLESQTANNTKTNKPTNKSTKKNKKKGKKKGKK